MGNKEKMLLGKLYDPNCKTLRKERKKCQKKLKKYQKSKNKRWLKKLIQVKSDNFEIAGDFYCDYGYNIIVGDHFYANHRLLILDENLVCFGDHVFVGPDCSFYTAIHPKDKRLRRKGYEYAKPITVGEDVWFGGNVTVLPGVTIGNDVIIGAGSVVTKDIEDHSIAVGNPCRVIKKMDKNEPFES